MTDLNVAIKTAIQYLTPEIDIPADVWKSAIKARVFKASGDIASISATYHDAITAALTTYFEGGSITGPKNSFKRAMVEAFGSAFDTGWQDGGGEGRPDDEALEWFNPRVDAELGFVDGVFQQVKELRKEDGFDFFAWVTAKSDAYTRTLASIYNAGVMLAKKNQMLTWHLGNTEKHCDTCRKLDGGSHRAAWYISRDYIPRKPGAAMDCGGYFCDCSLTGKDGNEVTI